MRCLNQAAILVSFALSGLPLGNVMAADGSQVQEGIRSLEMKSRRDSFLQTLGHGENQIVQVVSYKFTPQIRVYEMGTATTSLHGVTRGQLMASSLEGETGRRETGDCQAFHYKERGNKVYGAEVQLVPLHDGPYIIEVTGSPAPANASTKTLDYRIVIQPQTDTQRTSSPTEPDHALFPPEPNSTNGPTIAEILALWMSQRR